MECTGRRQDNDVPGRRKRVITEARKEQNRAAQQAYRQRQKEHRLSKPRSHGNVAKKFLHLKPRQRSTFGPHDHENPLLPNFTQVLSDHETGIEGFGHGDISGDGSLFRPKALGSVAWTDTSIGLESGHSNDSFNQASCIVPQRSNGDSEVPFNFDNWTNTEGTAIVASTASNLVAPVNSALLDHYCTSLELLALEVPQVDVSLCYSNSTLSSGDFPQSDIFNLVGNSHHNPELDTSIDSPSNCTPGIDTLITAMSNFLAPRPTQSTTRSSYPLPDPYANSMLYFRTSTLLPYLYNARCIGVSIQDLIAIRSPFHRPNTSMEEDATSLLKAARKPWFPDHLQPTLAQVLFPHHPYIDLLPFPALRERAITLAALFDPMELKRDIFREGLACCRETWGVRSLDGRQPWDGRSWEIKAWFEKKWRLLMEFSVTEGGQEVRGLDGLWPVVNMN